MATYGRRLDGLWTDADSWRPSGVPGKNDNITISGKVITINATTGDCAVSGVIATNSSDKLIISEGATLTKYGQMINFRGEFQMIGSNDLSNPTTLDDRYEIAAVSTYSTSAYATVPSAILNISGYLFDDVNNKADVLLIGNKSYFYCVSFLKSRCNFYNVMISGIPPTGYIAPIFGGLNHFRSTQGLFGNIICTNIQSPANVGYAITTGNTYLTGKLIFDNVNTHYCGMQAATFDGDEGAQIILRNLPANRSTACFNSCMFKGDIAVDIQSPITSGAPLSSIRLVDRASLNVTVSGTIITSSATAWCFDEGSTINYKLYPSTATYLSYAANKLLGNIRYTVYNDVTTYGIGASTVVDSLKNYTIDISGNPTAMSIVYQTDRLLDFQLTRSRHIAVLGKKWQSGWRHRHGIGDMPQNEPVVVCCDEVNNLFDIIHILDPDCNNKNAVYRNSVGVTWNEMITISTDAGLTVASSGYLAIDSLGFSSIGLDVPITSFANMTYTLTGTLSGSESVTFELSFDGGATYSTPLTLAQMNSDNFTINGDIYVTSPYKDIQFKVKINNPTATPYTITRFQLNSIGYNPDISESTDVVGTLETIKGAAFDGTVDSLTNISDLATSINGLLPACVK